MVECMKLSDSIQYLKGVGPKALENYQKLGISTLEDLLFYFPFRYEDFSGKSALELMDGEKATVVGVVVTPVSSRYYGFKKNRLNFKIKQDELVISVSFFNQAYLAQKIEVGANLAIYGKWDARRAALSGIKLLAQIDNGREPVYRLKEGVKQGKLVSLIKQVMDLGALNLIEETLPAYLLEKYRLLPRSLAVFNMHFPEDDEAHRQALRRVKFEELFYFQLKMQALKYRDKKLTKGLSLPYDDKLLLEKINQLPFDLTQAQERALDEICRDLRSNNHMNRLLQGDVGSGKTAVASLAMYAAHTAGFQSAMMVPTEILANQHLLSLKELFPELRVGLLTSGMKPADKREVLAGLVAGSVDMVVGTHALIQDGVEFKNLGLVITDEQHRFGVKQRKFLREKGENSDVLMMTATPIPRTLAITSYGDMDVSIIDELPKGRVPITTRWTRQEQFSQVLAWIKDELKKGAQVYFISPLIEESETLDLKNAQDLYQDLKDYFGDQAKIALLHGRMKAQEKDEIMTSFKAKEYDILVSTTVIEVGVNVPDATIMVIMNADRFGLSQLHQLRGRVGRGSKKSYAILVANPKSDQGKERMKIMTETNNGFVLAEADLRMRGSGEIFGLRQSGLPEFTVSDIVVDYNILEAARLEAEAIFEDDNLRSNPQYRLLFENLSDLDIFD
ncbi:ATP-dependent DNA helicase RecG [Streptococcaceae bacterium ESL0729]|nr:ATP-dependent DNA helicase RecG [Streptococcaceae bacterium ESL0729]